MRVEIDLVRARLRAPFVSASGSVRARNLLVLRLDDGAGHVGWGEAAPLESYGGATVSDVRAALEDCRPPLERTDALAREDLLRECREVAVLPQAVAAVDMALWDLEGRRRREPVWRMLGARAAPAVELNHTIAAADRSGAAREAAAALGAGFHTIKVKVGLGDDAGRLAAVRAAAGPTVAIRLDANGAWSVDEAHAALRALAPAGVELCEEPVHGLDAFADLARLTALPLALDESVVLPGALDTRVCDAVCLKISSAGGISGLLDAARRAKAAGYRVYVASTLDGPLGIAAALHACAAVGPDLPCGLATLSWFEGRANPLPVRDGNARVPPGPGLGEHLRSWYAI